NDTLNREAFRLGRLVGGEVLNQHDAVAELHRAAHQAGLPSSEAATTIASGLTAGISRPRTIPDHASTPHNHRFPKEAAVPTKTDEGSRTGEHIASAPEPKPESPTVIALDQPEPPAEGELDFESIWGEVQASIDRARQALPDWPDTHAPDDLKPAIDEVLAYLAEVPVPDESWADVETLDAHWSAVHTAYADAATVVPPDQPEWTRISAIRTAMHDLWDTIREAAGSYRAELFRDVRLRGLMTALATRGARAIASLAASAVE